MVLLLVVSIVLQLAAAALCCWHMRVTRATAGWGLLLGAVLLMAVYRGVLLDGVVAGEAPIALDPRAESLSLFASGLLVMGLIWMRPFFSASWRAERAIRESAERLQFVMDSALDAVVGMDASGRVTEWNAQAEAIFGWTREQAVGRELSALIIPEPYRAAHRYGLRRYLDTGEGPVLNRRVELTALSHDGREFPVELTVVPARSGETPFFTAFVRDITDRKRAERQLARQALESRLLHRATMLASETDSFEESLQSCVDFVGELTGWPVGHAYLPDASRATLVSAGIWHFDAPERFREFRAAVESISFAPGEGLPGRVWNAGEPVWLPNLNREENFPRRDLCGRVALKSAFGFPITIRGETAAVIEFFAADETPLDPELLMTVRTLGEQVGRVIERKRAAEELRGSESRFRGLVEQAPVVIQIFAPDGTVVAANRAWEELWGSPRNELPGYNILADPQLEAKGVRPEIRRAFAGEAVSLPPVLYDPVETGKPGRKRWVEAFFYPVRDGDRITEVVLMLRDVTERIQVEEELRESERRFRRMADTAPVLIWMSDVEKKGVYFNQRWLEFTGRPLDDHLGDGWVALVHPDDLPALEACASAFQRFDGFTTQFRLRRADGEYRWVLDTGVPRFTPGGDFAGYIGSCVDIHDQKRTEEALRDSQERLQAIMDHSNAVIYLKDRDGRYLMVNRHWESATGKEGDDVFGRSVYDLYPHEVAEQLAAHDRRVLQTGTALQFEETVPSAKGPRTYISMKFPLLDAAGVPYALGGISTDITERKREENAFRFLARASDLLASTLDHEQTLAAVARMAVPEMADWCAVDVVDEDGSLVRLAVAHSDAEKVELAYRLQKQYPPDPGAPHGTMAVLRTGRPEWAAEIPDSLLRESARDERHLQILRGLGLKSYLCVPLAIRDRTLGVLTFVSAESGRRYGPSDLELAQELARRAAIAIENARLFSASEQELAERKRAELQLQAEYAFRRAIEGSIPAGVAVVSPEGRQTYVNPAFCRMVGWSEEELLGAVPPFVYWPPEELEAIQRAFETTLRGDGPGGFELRFQRRDGERFDVLVAVSPMPHRDGKITGWLACVSDITERKRAEEALQEANRGLQQANQEMEQFVYSVSHDLKSPLVTMTGFLGVLREDMAAGRMDDVPDSLGRIERATFRMGRLIDDLLQVSRAGRVRDELDDVDVTSLVRELAEELSPRLEEAGAELSIQEDMPRVIADRARLVAVFDNLLNNAIKYGANGAAPKIAVGAAMVDGRTRYFVRDNGPGIPARFHERIFGLFQRLGSQQEGTGVGLAIVARVMEVHGGRAWVESTPGQGATFWIEFPVEPVRAVPQRAGAPAAAELVQQ